MRVILDTEPDPQARALFDAAFGDDFTQADWQHCLGGTHAHAYAAGVKSTLIGHAAVVPRTLWHAGRELSTGYVEGVAVAPTHRRQGVGTTLMRALDSLIKVRFDLGALAATDEGAALYRALGWTAWTGPLSVRHRDGRVAPTMGELVLVDRTDGLDLTGELTCDHRPGDVW